MIKDGPRPLPLQFYVPDTEIVVAEREHMVKYDSKTTDSPTSPKEWKSKYVVIGGVIAQAWMMNMYRSKFEYDTAVRDKQAKRSISVKVKRFSLNGAQILNDWDDLQMANYKNEPSSWHFFVVIPKKGKPIKISSTSSDDLKGVYDGIQRALKWEQQQLLENRHLHNSPHYNYPENNNLSAAPVSTYPDSNILPTVPVSLYPNNNNLPANLVSMYPDNNNLSVVPVSMYPDNNDLPAAPISMYPDSSNLSAPHVSMYPDNNNLSAFPPALLCPDSNNMLADPPVANNGSHGNNATFQDWNGGHHHNGQQQQHHQYSGKY